MFATIIILCAFLQVNVSARENLVILFENYHPFAYEEKGQFMGIEIDVLRKCAESLGIKAEFIRKS
jgi:hypothetical protein